jgi:putative heme iron utilization protein
MIKYSYDQIENGDWVITNVDANSTMFILSDEQAEDGTFVRGFPEHVQMIKDFQDVSKLEYFISLLETNPGTAFTIYSGN